MFLADSLPIQHVESAAEGVGTAEKTRRCSTHQDTPIWVGRHDAHRRPDIYRRRKSAWCVRTFMDHLGRVQRDKVDKPILSRPTCPIWRCSWTASSAQSRHFSLAGVCCHSAMHPQSCRQSLGNFVLLVMWNAIRYPCRLRINEHLERRPREDQSTNEASVNGDPNKKGGTAYDALGAQQQVQPWVLVKFHETNLLNVSWAVCSRPCCPLVLPSHSSIWRTERWGILGLCTQQMNPSNVSFRYRTAKETQPVAVLGWTLQCSQTDWTYYVPDIFVSF